MESATRHGLDKPYRLRDVLQIPCDSFSIVELTSVLKKLRLNKSAGADNIPAEFYKVCCDCPVLINWLLNFVNHVWNSKQIPEAWHLARVACILKKGDPTCPENYRSISLLPIGYKIFSSLIPKRLKGHGLEDL